MRRRIRNSTRLQLLRMRLRDQRGFMLAEQLVSIIFIGLLCIVVSAGLGAALSSYGSITQQARANSMLSDTVELISDQLAFARGTVSVSGDESAATFVSPTMNTEVQLQNTSNGIILHPVKGGSDTVLVPARDGMKPFVEVSLVGGNVSWSLTVRIVPENAPDTSSSLVEVQNLTVLRIGS